MVLGAADDDAELFTILTYAESGHCHRAPAVPVKPVNDLDGRSVHLVADLANDVLVGRLTAIHGVKRQLDWKSLRLTLSDQINDQDAIISVEAVCIHFAGF